MARRNIDIQALRQQIHELDIDNELKSRLLDAVSEQKKYGLVWENHKEEAEEVMREKLPVLIEDNGKRLDKGGKDAPNHILIEGDNLHALTALTYTHEGMVDVIYIDPPYNTGNKDFVYNDSFVDLEDGYRHSKWLSFMEKRLHIAKKLLSDRGVIFISIDDNEQANLKLLCDEVFGCNNFVTTIHVEMSATQGMKVKAAQKGNIVKNAEYILLYSKSGQKDIARTLLYDYRPEYDEHYSKMIKNDRLVNVKDIFSLYYPNLPLVSLTDMFRKYDEFKVFVLDNISNIFADDKISGYDINKYEVGKIYNVYSSGKKYLIYNNGTKIRQLLPLSSSYGQCDDFKNSYGLRKIRGDWWKEFYKDMGNVSKEGNVVYPNGKKPVRLIFQLIKMCSYSDSVILDFFAGSGTTAHATMLANNLLGGHRYSILIQSQENQSICEEITYKRINNVIESLSNNNLRYYKVDFVDRENTRKALRKQAYAMTDILCIKEGVYTEMTSFGCLPLSGKEKMIRYFADDKKQMLLIYDSRVIPFVVREIAKMADDTNIKVYVFADGSYPYTADFDEVLGKVTLIAMPYAMNSALKNVMPEKQDEIMEGEPENIDDND